ncbi:HOXC4 [Cordylochernes scorpioides]|uniref:HOXC4 n=1 Tax=Cordylochernes scorpioides TaxID=51811 RepID=A0ABY6LU00_9ARAC|nr:HOXC4 [Cordylochernes scorpioides]UYV83797.1 HOXC4 [Cordylochernes scorpioides]
MLISAAGRSLGTDKRQPQRKIISIQFTQKLMIMSSFLMNSPAYVDPKFPPSEEYSQASYIPTHGGATEYYGPPPPQAPYPYVYAVNNPLTAAAGYGAQENGVYGGDAHYYQHSCSMGGPPASLGPPRGPPRPDAASPPGLLASHRSPGSSPASPGGLGPPRPALHNSPSPDCAVSTGGGGGGQPVIYPWMKKAHIGSGGFHVGSQQIVLSRDKNCPRAV